MLDWWAAAIKGISNRSADSPGHDDNIAGSADQDLTDGSVVWRAVPDWKHVHPLAFRGYSTAASDVVDQRRRVL